MTPSDIKPGMKFGHWEVIKFDHSNEHRIKYFLCKCDVCGNTRPVRATSLISGYSTACSKQCQNSLNGMTFGRWHVLKLDQSNRKNYICQCECGTIKSVFAGSLKAGTTKSCGCLKDEHDKQRNQEAAETKIGQKFGKLTVLSCEKRNKDYWYNCQCDCGNKVVVLGKNLFNGNTSSCGCLNSKANELMDKLLTEEGVPFKREYKFEQCCDKKPLPFDFAIFNYQDELVGLIELSGSQHYQFSNSGWNTQEHHEYIRRHDKIKIHFCEENKIPLLTIPYQFFNELDKFLKSSEFWSIVTRNLND